jgi:tetratricopeptide (TPR) repeat protein
MTPKSYSIPNGDSAIQVARGDALFSRGLFGDALACFLDAQRQKSNVAEYAYRAGLAYWRLGQHDSARLQYEAALRLNPDYAAAHGELGRVLLAMGNITGATFHATRAAELAPDDPDLATALASVLEADRHDDAAAAIVQRLIGQGVESTDLAMVYSRLAMRRGEEKRAIAFIDRLLNKTPTLGSREQSALHFSAANLLDRLGRYDQAFENAERANRLRGVRYDPIQTGRSFQNFIDFFSREMLDRLSGVYRGGDLSRHPSADTGALPVFIIGMPRSGTSLVEQILASHPQVHGAGELDWIAGIFESALQRGSRAATPTLESLRNLLPADIADLQAQYLQPLQALNPAARRITDKMPLNFIHLGLIAILFPQAKMIHCRRDPLDTCLSCFMTDFTAGHEFSSTLNSLGHFYRQYDRMMSHWKTALPMQILELQYEQLVNDIEPQTRHLLSFLELPWDDKCLRFHENRRFVGTASNSQVRRPLYQSSVGRWKNYERQLSGLVHLLRPSS